MKRLFALIALVLLPVWGLGQHRAVVTRPAPAKAETKEARYARLDQFARQLPEAQAATLDKLAASLAAQARSDDDKARLIFSWLAYHIAYDVAYANDTTQYLRRCVPAYVLQNRKAVCQGYAYLFTELALRMKLQASTVPGHGHTESDTCNLLTDATGHAWNAYRIAGTWHFADATWGAGGTNEKDEFEYRFKPFWFDTPPSQLIFSHLPDSVGWQQLPTPVTPAIFQNWPYVEHAWFELVGGEGMRKVLAAPADQRGKFPEIQSNPLNVRLIQAPRYGDLVANQPVKFVFSVPAGVKMTIVTDTSRVPLQAVGSYWQATVTPPEGNIWVLVESKNDDSISYNILKYTIVPAPPQRKLRPGEHRKAPVYNVVYLRP